MAKEKGSRIVADCRLLPGSTCTVSISGTEEEVVPLALYHAIHDHGEKDTAELKEQVRRMLVDEMVSAKA